MNEAETRAELIDPALAAAGWGIVEGSRIRREYAITLGRIEGAGKRAKPLIADYVLEYRGAKLAVIEAKARDLSRSEGVGQAKDYAQKLCARFAYSTNGLGIYGIDMQTAGEGELAQFPTPEDLWARTFAQHNLWRDRFAAVPFEDKGGTRAARYYQEIAVNRVLDAIAENKSRILLTLATGTGKTFIAFQIVWKLFCARWNLQDWSRAEKPTRRPRVLILADRNVLANQAYNEFDAFSEDALVRIAPESIRKKGGVPTNGSVFFTIFQTFMSGPNDTPHFGEYPPDFFDFIIIDECHRGGAKDESTWRDILNYFSPAVQLGLTATPKRSDNADTYAYFGEPVYVYSLKDGINDGYLTPFRVKQISTTLDDYVYTADDFVVEGEIERGRRYVEADFNRVIEIKAREQKRVEIFMRQIDQREKTIVFCATQEHALAVRDLINQMKTSRDVDYCHRVTADDGKIGEQHLKNFQDGERNSPLVLTTSVKLSTGVDARNVRNIVLMRPVNSMIEFKQIIGRGTRLFDGKDYFTIYDFVRAHHHFSDPEWDGEPIAPEPQDYAKPRTLNEPTKVAEPRADYVRSQRVKISLADGKARTIQHMMCTSFWHTDGTPMSAAQFMESLYGKLPEFFKNEDELRAIWSAPDTRKSLLEGLAEKGIGEPQLIEMQTIIQAEHSDLFDVLAYVAYAHPAVARRTRADKARAFVHVEVSQRHRAFVDFVLDQYIDVGVTDLGVEKLGALLELKYRSVSDAVVQLGAPEEIKGLFFGFQRHLYSRALNTAE